MPDNGTIELAGALNGTLDLEGELNGLIQVPKDGYSPTVTVTDITGGHRITITDEDGDHTYDVMDGVDGVDGTDGTDGVSPTVTVTDISGGHQVAITDADGTTTFNVMDGANGADGADGGTPTVVKENVYQSWSGPAGSSLSSERTGFYLTITDAEGNETTTGNIMEAWPVLIKASKSGGVTTVKFYTDSSDADATLTINDGADGQDGAQGPAGPGVPTGGTAGQVLKKASGTNYDTEWADEEGGGGSDEIFVAEFGTTIYAEVLAAFNAGKAIFCLYKFEDDWSLMPMIDHTDYSVHQYNEPFIFGIVYGYGSCLFASLADEENLSDAWYGDLYFFRDKLLPSGGTTDQVLAKTSSSDYAVKWLTLPQAATSLPSDLGTAAIGSSTKYAKQDHVHKMPSASDVGAIATPSSPSSGQYLKYNGSAWAADNGPSVPSAYTSSPAALGTASPGSSSDYAKGDHVHPKPSAADLGVIAAPSSPTVGDFLVYTSNGWAAQSLSTWSGGNY